jgi:GT2 family glycosyltransferase
MPKFKYEKHSVISVKVSIITSMYNRKNSIIHLIDKLFFPSLINNASKDAELIILDDASPLKEETKALVEKYLPELKRKFKSVVFERNTSNLGFAGSFNKGIRMAKGEKLVLLNDDLYLPKGSISLLVKTLYENKCYGLVGPITNEKTAWTCQYCRQAPKIKSLSKAELGKIDAFAKLSRKLMKGKRVATNYLCGACLAADSSILRKEGLFDESYKYGLYEDADLSRKLSKKYEVIVNPEVFIYHGGPKGTHNSLMQQPARTLYHGLRNTFKFGKKCGYFTAAAHIARGIYRSTGRDTVSRLFEEALSKN